MGYLAWFQRMGRYLKMKNYPNQVAKMEVKDWDVLYGLLFYFVLCRKIHGILLVCFLVFPWDHCYESHVTLARCFRTRWSIISYNHLLSSTSHLYYTYTIKYYTFEDFTNFCYYSTWIIGWNWSRLQKLHILISRYTWWVTLTDAQSVHATQYCFVSDANAILAA